MSDTACFLAGAVTPPFDEQRDWFESVIPDTLAWMRRFEQSSMARVLKRGQKRTEGEIAFGAYRNEPGPPHEPGKFYCPCATCIREREVDAAVRLAFRLYGVRPLQVAPIDQLGRLQQWVSLRQGGSTFERRVVAAWREAHS